jgi:tetratricopeptide (TPR) repeat protein
MLEEDQVTTLKILGFLLRRLGRTDKALRLYQALLADSPGDLTVLAPAAASALEAGQPQQALDMLDRLRDGQDTDNLSNDSLEALGLLKAQALYRLGRLDEASALATAWLDRTTRAGGTQ